MPPPTLVKTWQIVPNILVGGGPDEHGHAQNLMFAIHSELVGFAQNPWIVNYSCDGSTPGVPDDGVDRWDAANKIIWSTGAHSWIVYDLPAGPQLLIDLDYNTSTCEFALMRISPSAGFTGGTTGARPTAPDECKVITEVNGQTTREAWSGWATMHTHQSVDNRVHIWHSTDGLLTRVAIYRSGVCPAFWEFGDMADKRDAQTNPFTWGVFANDSTSTLKDVLLTGPFQDPPWLHSYHVSEYLNYHLCLGFGNKPWIEHATASLPEDLDSELHVTPWTLWSATVGFRGFKGTVIDRWASPYQALNVGDNSPASPATRDFVHMNVIMLPWTGDATVMLIA